MFCSRYLVQMVSALSLVSGFVHGMAAQSAADSAVTASVTRQHLCRPPEDKQIAWLVHRGGWGDSPAYGTRIDSFHHDEMADDFSAGLNSEFKALKQLTNATFLQDFGNLRDLAKAATANGLDYAMINTLSPLAMSNFGIKTPQDCVDYLVRQVSVLKEFPNHTRIDGRPVIFVFNISGFPPAVWKQILADVRAAVPEEDLLFIGHRSVVHVLGHVNPQGYMTGLLDAFDGIMFWSALTDKKLENLELARNAMKTLGKEKLIFWVASNGYWRPEKGMYVDPQGTKVWRDQLQLSFSNQFDGLMIESWNDLEEHTQVAPTRDAGGVLMDLLKYYSAVSNQKKYHADAPGLLLTHPREILLGDQLNIEVLTLPVAAARHTFRLELIDASGGLVYRSGEQPVPPDAADVLNFVLPTASLTNTDYVQYRLVVDGQVFTPGTATELRRSIVVNPWNFGVVLSDLIPSDHMGFNLKPAENGYDVSIDIQHDTPLSRVDLYRGESVVWSLDAERLNQQRTWSNAPVAIQLDFRMPGVSSETLNRGGTLTLSDGIVVRGFNKMGRSAADSSPVARWDTPASIGRQESVKLLLDTPEDAPLTLTLPAYKQTLTFTIRELREKGRIEHKTSAHGRLWIQEILHPVIWRYEPGALGKEVHEQFTLPAISEGLENDYFLRAVDKNGKVWRSDAVRQYAGHPVTGGAQWLWDASTGRRFVSDVPDRDARQFEWYFDGPESRVYDDNMGCGITALLGGGMYRAGHFEPDAVPQHVRRDNGTALRFDGNDYVQLTASVFPQGAFELAMDVFPEAKSPDPQMLFFNRLNLLVFIRSDGRVEAQIKGLAGMEYSAVAAELASRSTLPLNQWSTVKVRYDYQEFTLEINGEPVSVPLAVGPDRDMSAESYLGAQVEGTQGTVSKNFFAGEMDNLVIRCGASAE